MSEIDKFDFLDACLPEKFKKRLDEYDSAVNIKKILKRNWKIYAFIIAGIAAIIGFILGYIGIYFDKVIDSRDPANIIYEVLKLYVLQNSFEPSPIEWQLWIAIYLCPASFAYFAVMTVVTVLQDTLLKIRLEFFKNHVVICGLNKWTSQLARDLRHSKYKQVVIISKEKDNEYLTKAQDMKVIVLNGNCSDEFLLYRANIHKAKYLVAFTEDDTKNMESAINAKKLIKSEDLKNTPVKKNEKLEHLKVTV